MLSVRVLLILQLRYPLSAAISRAISAPRNSEDIGRDDEQYQKAIDDNILLNKELTIMIHLQPLTVMMRALLSK